MHAISVQSVVLIQINQLYEIAVGIVDHQSKDPISSTMAEWILLKLQESTNGNKP